MMKRLLFILMLLLPMTINAQEDSLVDNNTDFAFDLYQSVQAQESGNFMFSPYSISQAFALVYSGAAGDTATQIQDALHFLPQDELPDAFAALTEDLTTREYPFIEGEDVSPLTLNIANALWGQEGYPFNQDYLTLMESAYGAGIREVNFVQDAESARQTINDWVSEQTNQRIQNIIPSGAVDELTRLVLTNAIYFKASWQSEFTSTQDADFTLLDGSTVTVPMMQNQFGYAFAQGDGFTAVELPYLGGDMSMIALLPDEFEAFEDDLTAESFREIVDALSYDGMVRLFMPQFEYEFTLPLNGHMQSLGVVDAFDPDAADFSGLADSDEPLFISSALHKSFIKVDEEGTEAAAATALIVGTTSFNPQEPLEIRLDRPFIYAIYDRETGSVLFLGRVMNPETVSQ